MSSANRRPLSSLRAALLILTLSVTLVAPMAAAEPRAESSFDFSFGAWWQPVVAGWNQILEVFFAPDGFRLDPDGDGVVEPPPPPTTAMADGQEVPNS